MNYFWNYRLVQVSTPSAKEKQIQENYKVFQKLLTFNSSNDEGFAATASQLWDLTNHLDKIK